MREILRYPYTVLHSMGADNDCAPLAALSIQGGLLFGTNSRTASKALGGDIFSLQPSGIGYKSVHAFSDPRQGLAPESHILFDAKGIMYGTTFLGGASAACNKGSKGVGVIYKIFRDGSLKVMRTLGPRGGIFAQDVYFGPDGAIYGTTASSCSGNPNTQNGTVFRITRDGDFSELHRFEPMPDNIESQPRQLAFGPDGTIYGQADNAGSRRNALVWSLAPGASGQPWVYTEIFRFPSHDDEGPTGLVIDGAGNLYGTNFDGGPYRNIGGFGLLFRLSPPKTGSTWTYTVLHNFGHDSSDGSGPRELLLENGVLYGTTSYGGAGFGTAFSYKLP